MKLDIAVLADAANVSREGKLNICGIFRNIFGPQLPVLWPAMTIALQLTLEAAEKGKRHTMDLRLNDPSGRVLQQFPELQFEVPAEAPGATASLPLTLNLVNMSFAAFGIYCFVLRLNGAEVQTLEFEVVASPAQPPMPPPALAG